MTDKWCLATAVRYLNQIHQCVELHGELGADEANAYGSYGAKLVTRTGWLDPDLRAYGILDKAKNADRWAAYELSRRIFRTADYSKKFRREYCFP